MNEQQIIECRLKATADQIAARHETIATFNLMGQDKDLVAFCAGCQILFVKSQLSIDASDYTKLKCNTCILKRDG